MGWKAERIGGKREGDFTDNFIVLLQYSKFKFEPLPTYTHGAWKRDIHF
jgi:hypothetical protein